MKKNSPQLRRLKLPTATRRPVSPPIALSSTTASDSSEANSPLTARKKITTESRLEWARRVLWQNSQDNRDEHYTPSELLAIAEEEQALILEAFAVLYLHNTTIQNELDEQVRVHK